ncbi:MAG: MoxR family ATPase [Planctomycetota bacterium]
MSSVVLGKRDQAELCLIALFAGEHVLMEDVPGVGKTLLGKALSRSVSGQFSRIQFTPDLLPGDILGSSVYNTTTAEFQFHQGAIFNNFVLADEINRAPPRTQSALLEAMSDRQVSVDGTTYTLPDPFMVIATQNPFEFEGTYVLPESQLDRFLLRFSMGYPDRSVENDILTSHRDGQPVDRLKPVCEASDLVEIQQAVRQVKVEESISSYMLDVAHATRDSKDLSVGVSTRGVLAWYSAARAMAFVSGRDYVIPDDVRDLAVVILAHRVQATGIMQGTQRSHVESLVKEIVSHVPLPT